MKNKRTEVRKEKPQGYRASLWGTVKNEGKEVNKADKELNYTSGHIGHSQLIRLILLQPNDHNLFDPTQDSQKGMSWIRPYETPLFREKVFLNHNVKG